MAHTLHTRGTSVRQEAADATIASIAGKVTATAAGTAFLGGVSANTVAAIGGLIVAIVGLIVTIFYKHRADQRGQQAHDLRMQRLRDRDDGREDAHE